MTESLQGGSTAPPAKPSHSSLQPWREIVLLRLSTLILVVGTPVVVVLAWHHWHAGRHLASIVSTVGLPLMLVVRFGRAVPFRLRAVLQVGIFLVGGIIGYLLGGLAGSGAAVFVAATVLAALLLGAAWGIAVLASSVVALAVVGLLFAHGRVPVPDVTILDPSLAGNWWRATAFYGVLSSTILAVVLYLLGRLEGSLHRSWELVQDLRKEMIERERLESHLREAQKTRAIGTLAAGIAHDFNNILAGLICYAELARRGAPSDSELHDDLDQVLQAAERAKILVSRILAASRQREGARRPMRIQSVLDEVILLLRATIPATIEIRPSIEPDCPAILGDPTQIHQLVMNLCTNAFQAMRDQAGILEVGLRRRLLSDTESAGMPRLRSRGCAEICVRDTGCGMDEATLARIFEPYFTTRTQGDGTGLGLATVNTIVHSHSGAISVKSEPGKGSTFFVLFPLCESDISPSPPRAQSDSPHGTERILFVDDESQIAEASNRALSRLGYRVTCHTSPESAVHAFQSAPFEFDLVVTDLGMPRMSGAQVARKIRHLRPEIPVIVCSGFSDTAHERELDELKVQRTLMKPVLTGELAMTIREVLDAREPA